MRSVTGIARGAPHADPPLQLLWSANQTARVGREGTEGRKLSNSVLPPRIKWRLLPPRSTVWGCNGFLPKLLNSLGDIWSNLKARFDCWFLSTTHLILPPVQRERAEQRARELHRRWENWVTSRSLLLQNRDVSAKSWDPPSLKIY